MPEPVGRAELREAARGGYRKNTQASKTTIGMRMGHLSAFFNRIIEWDYPAAPARPPVFASDRPIKVRPHHVTRIAAVRPGRACPSPDAHSSPPQVIRLA